MRPMAKTPGGFRAALLIGWIALSAAGILYARVRGIPSWAALPVLAAFLVEYPFYLVMGFPSVRERFTGLALHAFLVASAALPYLACCCGAIRFQWASLLQLSALALALSLWFVVLPAVPAVDLAFLALLPAVLLGRYFDTIYPAPYKGVDLIILGHLALIQIGVMTLLVGRRVHESGFGFWPNGNDWWIGARHFLYFLPIGFPLALLLKAMRFAGPAPLWKIAALFTGFLWVVALSEEFLFRGVLLEWVEGWTASRNAALLLTSVAFGLVHLGFRVFPNWRWVLMAAVLGWFCGRARIQAGSIRAGMVTHALVFTAWQAFFV